MELGTDLNLNLKITFQGKAGWNGIKDEKQGTQAECVIINFVNT